MHYLIVFAGGGIGAALRHGVNRLALCWFGAGSPIGTMFVNVAGSLLMGLLIGAFAGASGGVSNQLRLFLTVGVLGGFTTFSAFSLDALTLWERGQPLHAAGYVVGSVVLSLAAISLGYLISR